VRFFVPLPLLVYRWYTNYNEFIGAVAIFLTATAAVVLEQQETELGPGRIGLALFSVFQARLSTFRWRLPEITTMRLNLLKLRIENTAVLFFPGTHTVYE